MSLRKQGFVAFISADKWSEYAQHIRDVAVKFAMRDLMNGSVEYADDISVVYHYQASDRADSLAMNTQKLLGNYLQRYRVKPANADCDELKLIYFVGLSIYDSFSEFSRVDIHRIHLRSMLYLMDKWAQHEDTGTGKVPSYRHQLSERVLWAILEDKIFDDFGRYGWYIAYKALSNASSGR